LFDPLFDKNSSRQGSSEAIGSGSHGVIVPTSCFRACSRHFHCAEPGGEPALQNFHATEMAV
jgi:hypothetical protein